VGKEAPADAAGLKMKLGAAAIILYIVRYAIEISGRFRSCGDDKTKW
jgi:hypothetical protein